MRQANFVLLYEHISEGSISGTKLTWVRFLVGGALQKSQKCYETPELSLTSKKSFYRVSVTRVVIYRLLFTP